jgi:undecaprenyl-diphosphatase
MISGILSIDLNVLQTLYAMQSPTVVYVFIWVSELGSSITIAGLSVILALVLAWRRQYALGIGLATCITGSALAVYLLKEFMGRARPDVYYRAIIESGYSFPSGHATLSAAFYGFLIYLAWRMVPSHKRRIVVTALLGALIALISFSRLYLGVHYLSDVVAGFIVGGAFVWLGVIIAQKLIPLKLDFHI